jgi:hypothetical protein
MKTCKTRQSSSGILYLVCNLSVKYPFNQISTRFGGRDVWISDQDLVCNLSVKYPFYQISTRFGVRDLWISDQDLVCNLSVTARTIYIIAIVAVRSLNCCLPLVFMLVGGT